MLSESEVHTEKFDLVSIRKKGNLLTKRLWLAGGQVHVCIAVHLIGRLIVGQERENVATHIEDVAE